jgi:Family of unknown function (DUF6011)
MAIFTNGTQQIESNLTYGEAAELLSNLQSGFAQSLASQYRQWSNNANRRYPNPWSPAQQFWAFKLAETRRSATVEPPAPVAAQTPMAQYTVISTPNIAEMLFKPTKLKSPKIVFQVNDGKIAFLQHRNSTETFVIIFNNGQSRKVVGYITKQGECKIYPQMPTSCQVTLDEFESSPLVFVSEYGKRTGACCFCRLSLKDERSVKAGYGPICAKHYHLPWGE